MSFDVGDVKDQLDGVRPGGIVERDVAAAAQATLGILRTRERSNGNTIVHRYSYKVLLPQKIASIRESIISDHAKAEKI